MKYILACVSIIALTVGVLFLTDARAQQRQCELPPGQVFQMIKQLGEKPFLIGPGPNGTTGIVARNPETKSWTFLLMAPDGCVAIKVGGDNSTSFDEKSGNPT